MAGSRRNSDASFPPITIHRGTPCPGPVNGAAGNEVDTRLLPSLTPYRSVLSSGGQSYQWTNNGPFKEPHPIQVKSEGTRLLHPCGKDPRNYLASPHMEQAPHVNMKSRQHLAPLSPSGHHLRPPGRHVTPTSPTFSDISSIRLTPRSPAAGHFGAAESPCCNNGRHKTPVRSRTIPTISSGVLLSSSLSMELDEASVSPLIPSINSYSPHLNSYLHTPVDYGSPHGVAAAAVNAGHFTRKRPLSSSPLSDLVDLNSMIRTSPSSLVAYINNSQSPAGVMGHLVGPPALIHARANDMLPPPPLQRKSTTTTITNQITITQHAHNELDTSSNMALLVPASSEKSLEDNEPLEPLVCRWLDCEQVFEDQDDMVRHIEKVHVEEQRRGNEFVCWWQGCGRNKKPFNARYKLLIHMRIHSGEKPNKCSYPGCNKAFSRLENLKIHMRSHTGERPYLCQFPGCQKSFSNSSDRSKHQRTHIEEKPYACTYPNCVKRYTDPSSLRKHARTHQQPNKKARGEDNKEQLDSCLMVQGIQKNDKQSPTNTTSSGATNKKPAPIIVHHQPALYPTTSIMTDLQLPHSPYHLTAVHSPSMQQASHSPLMQASPSMQVNHSPLMQHPVPSHSPMMQSSTGTYLTANNGQFSNPPSPMAYSPASVMQQQQYIPGGGACHPYPAGQDTIPSRPPPEYPNNGYYGMNTVTFSHDQI